MDETAPIDRPLWPADVSVSIRKCVEQEINELFRRMNPYEGIYTLQWWDEKSFETILYASAHKENRRTVTLSFHIRQSGSVGAGYLRINPAIVLYRRQRIAIDPPLGCRIYFPKSTEMEDFRLAVKAELSHAWNYITNFNTDHLNIFFS